jgi:hypothetical protein
VRQVCDYWKEDFFINLTDQHYRDACYSEKSSNKEDNKEKIVLASLFRTEPEYGNLGTV